MKKEIQKIRLDLDKLPLIFEVIFKGVKKKYILKFGKERGGLYINKIEEY